MIHRITMAESRRVSWTRRDALLHGAASLLCFTGAGVAHAAPEPAPVLEGNAWEALERRSQGRLGVAVIDTANGRRFGHRQDERFPMCSTFKVLVAAAVLARVDRGEERLERRITFGEQDLLEHAPVARARVKEGSLALADLCAAAVTVSDNTAANLLLGTLGGAAGLTAYARGLGDTRTRLDRLEPTLNEARAGDERDTTTPQSMAQNLNTLLLGDALARASRGRLVAWMAASTTGLARLRAGVPAGYRVADKTGSGENGTTNDVGVAWPPEHEPPERKPIVLALYLTGTQVAPAQRDAVLADAARLALRLL
jgi:beta-lactamase class A